jgi:vitamin B12 transporter
MRNVNAAGVVLPESAVYPDRSDWEVSYRAGAVFDALETLQLRAAVYSGLRIPTLNELYRPFVVFPVTTNANAGLGIERLEGYEAGIDWTPVDPLRLSVTAFKNTINNAITNVTTVVSPTGTVTERQRQNVDAIEAQGLEFAAQLAMGRFSFDGTLSYTDAELQDSIVRGPNNLFSFNGNRPGQTPQWAASATGSFRPWEGALFAATVRHVGDQFEDDLNDDVLPAATTVDLFAQVPLVERLSAVARVENLFDEEIVTRNQGGSIDLGVPFTIWGGVRYGF